jgi:hypothetical protein
MFLLAIARLSGGAQASIQMSWWHEEVMGASSLCASVRICILHLSHVAASFLCLCLHDNWAFKKKKKKKSIQPAHVYWTLSHFTSRMDIKSGGRVWPSTSSNYNDGCYREKRHGSGYSPPPINICITPTHEICMLILYLLFTGCEFSSAFSWCWEHAHE